MPLSRNVFRLQIVCVTQDCVTYIEASKLEFDIFRQFFPLHHQNTQNESEFYRQIHTAV